MDQEEFKSDMKDSIIIIEDLVEDLNYYASKSDHVNTITTKCLDFVKQMKDKYGIQVT